MEQGSNKVFTYLLPTGCISVPIRMLIEFRYTGSYNSAGQGPAENDRQDGLPIVSPCLYKHLLVLQVGKIFKQYFHNRFYTHPSAARNAVLAFYNPCKDKALRKNLVRETQVLMKKGPSLTLSIKPPMTASDGLVDEQRRDQASLQKVL